MQHFMFICTKPSIEQRKYIVQSFDVTYNLNKMACKSVLYKLKIKIFQSWWNRAICCICQTIRRSLRYGTLWKWRCWELKWPNGKKRWREPRLWTGMKFNIISKMFSGVQEVVFFNCFFVLESSVLCFSTVPLPRLFVSWRCPEGNKCPCFMKETDKRRKYFWNSFI